jgi:hypothetical protein
MSYYMRYISTSAEPLTLQVLEAGLRSLDPKYRVAEDGDLLYGDELFGQLEVNLPDEELFEEEREELLEELEDAEDAKGVKVVRKVLEEARAIVALQVLFQGRKDTESTLQRIDPLWDWLYAHRTGLMQADGEGYYDAKGAVLELE